MVLSPSTVALVKKPNHWVADEPFDYAQGKLPPITRCYEKLTANRAWQRCLLTVPAVGTKKQTHIEVIILPLLVILAAVPLNGVVTFNYSVGKEVQSLRWR